MRLAFKVFRKDRNLLKIAENRMLINYILSSNEWVTYSLLRSADECDLFYLLIVRPTSIKIA